MRFINFFIFIFIFYYATSEPDAVKHIKFESVSKKIVSIKCDFKGANEFILCEVQLDEYANVSMQAEVFVTAFAEKSYDDQKARFIVMNKTQNFTIPALFENESEDGIAISWFRICIFAMDKTKINHSEFVQDVDCVEVRYSDEESSMRTPKPVFVLFMYALCLLLLSPLIIRYYYTKKKIKKLRKLSYKKSIDTHSDQELQNLYDEDEDKDMMTHGLFSISSTSSFGRSVTHTTETKSKGDSEKYKYGVADIGTEKILELKPWAD